MHSTDRTQIPTTSATHDATSRLQHRNSSNASGMMTTCVSSDNRKITQHLLNNILIVTILIVPIIVCEFAIEPYQRGFFCNDDSIKYPFHPNTITESMLGFIVVLPPIIIFLIIEYFWYKRRGCIGDTILICGRNIPIWVIEFFKQFHYFKFGLILTFNATELGKYTIGRLRPHFIDVCQPQLLDGSTCNDIINHNRYIENYICRADAYTMVDIRQARLSFPSGHSSLTIYMAIYCLIYLRCRINWNESKLTCAFIQFALLMLAWFTALSRVMDNWHHWSDVLVGILIGLIGALLTTLYISKLHKSKRKELNMKLSITRQDTSTTLAEVISTPPPYTTTMDSMNSSFNNDEYCTKV